jgi:16S rRNA (uracil1498-N3)-methyltransferase
VSRPPVRRFRVDSLAPGEDGLLRVDAGVHRHLRVLRLRPGDVVNLFDGSGGEVVASVATIDDDGTALRLTGSLDRRVESPLDSCLVQAIPARSSRMETIVRQLTELGIRRIAPVIAERSQKARLGAAALDRRAHRWRRVANAAAEQSGRSRVPAIDDVVSLADLSWESLPRPIFIADVGSSSARRPRTADAFSVLVGPEGGWSAAEVEAATAAGASPLSLGPRTLRADTAGAVAMTIFQFLWGDLDSE